MANKNNILIDGSKNITKNFKYEDIWKSNTATAMGINNIPSPRQFAVFCSMYVNMVQPIRDLLNLALKVNSSYRGRPLNTELGGASRSDHMCLDNTTAAIDLDDKYLIKHSKCNADIAKVLINSDIPFYKLILEAPEKDKTGRYPNSWSWIHISYSISPKLNNARYVYEAKRDSSGKMRYTAVNTEYLKELKLI